MSDSTAPRSSVSRLAGLAKVATILVFLFGASAYVAVASKPENDRTHAFHVLYDGGESGSWDAVQPRG